MRNGTAAPIRDGSVLVVVVVKLFGDELPIVGERQYLPASSPINHRILQGTLARNFASASFLRPHDAFAKTHFLLDDLQRIISLFLCTLLEIWHPWCDNA